MTLTRRGVATLAAAVAIVVTVAPSVPDLPNAPTGHGHCYEDIGCEDGTPWLCRDMGNRLCGPDVDAASTTRR